MMRGLREEETIDDPVALPLFGPMALWLHTEYNSALAPESEVRARFAEVFATEKQEPVKSMAVQKMTTDFMRRAKEPTGIFVEKATGHYGFWHLTFEEYWVARQLVSDPYALPAFIHAHRHLPRWEEPILLAISYVSMDSPKHASNLIRAAILGQTIPGISGHFAPDPDELILHRDLLFAATCLGDCVRVEPAFAAEMAGRLVSLYQELILQERFEPLRNLLLNRLEYLGGSTAGQRASEALARALSDDRFAHSGSIALGRIQPLPEVALSALVQLLRDSDSSVRMSAAQALGACCSRSGFPTAQRTLCMRALRAMLKAPSTDGLTYLRQYDRVHDFAWEALWNATARQALEERGETGTLAELG